MIHLYIMHGKRFALDVNSGAVLELDKLSYEILSHVDGEPQRDVPCEILKALSDEYKEEDIVAAYNEILQLKDDGMLYSSDDYEDIAKESGRLSPVKALCLHVAHDCNLRCEYCFASTGDFGGGRKLMDFETGKKAIDLVITQSQGRRNIEIDFFWRRTFNEF